MKQTLDKTSVQVHFGNDSIVCPKYISGIPGGKTLDVTDVTDTILNAGHVIITDGKGNYKPMPVSEGAYAALPENWSYAGILYRTIQKTKPAASIMTRGDVNEVASPYAVTAIKAAFLTAVPHISFIKDEEA